MATEEDSSIIGSFESLEVSSVQRNRKTTSNIHEYCRKPAGEEPVRDSQNRRLYYCSLCSYCGTSTTNIRRHFQSKHNLEIDKPVPRTKAIAIAQLEALWK